MERTVISHSQESKKRKRERKKTRDAGSVAVFDGALRGVWKKEAWGVDCSERDRGWQRCWTRKLVENLRAGRRKRDELKWKMRKTGERRCRGSGLWPFWVTRCKRQRPAMYCKRDTQCLGMFWFCVWMELLLLHVSVLFCTTDETHYI